MSDSIPIEVEEQIEQIGIRFTEMMRGLYQMIHAEDKPRLREIERHLRRELQTLGLMVMMLLVGGLERRRRKGARGCPTCGQKRQWKGYEKRQIIGLFGEWELERAYYYCAECKHGWVPLDEELGLGRREVSPALMEIAAELGACMPFAQAAQFLQKHFGVWLSHDTINRVTKEVGQGLEAQQKEEVARVWAGDAPHFELVSPAPDALYISADGVRFVKSNGEGAELKIGVIYEAELNAEEEPCTVRADYFVGGGTAEELGKLLYVQAGKRGLNQARCIPVLGDGADWIWNWIAPMFPVDRRVEINDFFHTSEYLWAAMAAVHGHDPDQTRAHAKAMCKTLKNGQVIQLIDQLAATGENAPEAVLDAVRYLRNRQSRMAYDRYRADGLQIGSGTVECACKRVVGARIKQPGMRWHPDTALAVAQTRAASLCNRLEGFFDVWRPPTRIYRRAA